MTPMPQPQPPTAAEIAAAREASKKLIEKARAFIVLDHPFFATIMLKHPFVESPTVATLAVSGRGEIFYNPMFIAQQTADQVVWAISHEILHYASGHAIRRQHRDQKMWNYAGDMWINDTLNTSGVGQKIEGCIDVPGSASRTVEDIYASFPPPDDGDSGGGGQPGGNPNHPTNKPGNGNGDGDGGGDPIANDMQGDDLTESEKSEIDANRKIEVAEAAQVAKMKGKLPGQLQKFAEDTVQSKTPWFDILERYMAGMMETEQSWKRPNRRYAPDFYLPSEDKAPSMGEVVIQVDISGSVSRQEIKHYNGHMKRIVEQCRPEKVHVIYTDTQVQLHETFDKPEDVQINYHSGGGTHMPAGFKYIEDKGIFPDVFVTLTDGYTGWDKEPSFPTIHCISSEQQAPYGVNVHFDMNEE